MINSEEGLMRSTFLMFLVLVVAFAAAAAQEQAVQDTAKPATSAAPEMGGAEAATEAVEMESPLSIERMTFCLGVEEREPVNEGVEFAADIGNLFFWSNVLNEGDTATVEHVWYLDGEEKARVELPVDYPRNRIWSSKIVPPEWAGTWKVEVVTADGKVLGEQTCTVK
jgi:hypothetical protein